jgi:hypothetical protein
VFFVASQRVDVIRVGFHGLQDVFADRFQDDVLLQCAGEGAAGVEQRLQIAAAVLHAAYEAVVFDDGNGELGIEIDDLQRSFVGAAPAFRPLQL